MLFTSIRIVAGAITGTIWALVKIKKADNFDQGWAFYCLYGSDGMIVISFIFSVVLLCTRAPGAYRATNRDDEIAMLAR